MNEVGSLVCAVAVSLSCTRAAAPGPTCADRTQPGSPACLAPLPSAAEHRPATVRLKILGINDFHGQIAEGRTVSGRPVGGAAVLASYLKAAQAGFEGRTLIIHAGDQVGASPADSALLQDEPAIQFLNTLANPACQGPARDDPTCNIVGSLGNHEFDEGKNELLRLIRGGNHARGPFLQDPYPGARFPYVSANVRLADTDAPLLKPYVVRELDGVKVGVIGAVLKEAPAFILPSSLAGLAFTDEVKAINEQVAVLRAEDVRTIVVALHQGTHTQSPHAGPTDPKAGVGPPVSTLVSQLDDEVDVVISGHAHSFTNAYVPTASGRDVLVVQAFSGGSAYDDIDLEIDRATGNLLKKSARIVTTYSDVPPGNDRDPAVQTIVDSAKAKVAPRVNQPVARVTADITRAANSAGESQLGDLIADSERAALGTDFAFVNAGATRTDLVYAKAPDQERDADGLVLWGELFAILPFGNTIVKLEMTGRQIHDLLNQQFAVGRSLYVSGLAYTWDGTQQGANRIIEIRRDGTPIDPARTYTVAVNSYLAESGDRFTVFAAARVMASGPTDVDAFAAYLASLPQPVVPPALGRITKRESKDSTPNPPSRGGAHAAHPISSQMSRRWDGGSD